MKNLRVITNSERSTYACPRKWFFQYKLGLTHHKTPVYFAQGGLMHQLLDSHYTTENPCIGSYMDVIDPWIESRKEIASSMGPGAGDYLNNMQSLATETLGMMAHYAAHYSDDLDRYEVIDIEPQISRWITCPKYGTPLQSGSEGSPIPVAYGGRVDGIFRDKRSGLAFLFETKTTAESDPSNVCRDLDIDPQIRSYAWALANPNEHSEIKEPINIAGVIYNVIRKAIPKEPKVLKSGKLSRDKRQETTPELMLQAIEKHGENPEDFSDVLDHLKAKKWFHREIKMFSDRDFEDAHQEIYHGAQEILRAEKADYHIRQTPLCRGKRGFACPYKPICADDTEFGRSTYRTRTIRHEELEGDLADSNFLGKGLGDDK